MVIGLIVTFDVSLFCLIVLSEVCLCFFFFIFVFFFQAEDGIRYLVRSRGLGDVYKRQLKEWLRLALRFVATLPAK